MNQQIQKTLTFIEQNLQENLSVDDVANFAGYSKFHFSRIFKVHVGESVIDYITRLKIEKSSLSMMSKLSIIEVALNFGYQTPNGYNKAFKKAFGVSPSEYKKNKFNFLENFKRKLMETPKIVELEEKHIVFERETGAYEKSDIAWEKLSKKLNKIGQDKTITEEIIIDAKDGEYFGICHDDPSVTQEEKIRYDAAISWERDKVDFLEKQGIDTKVIHGGKYAMTTFQGDPNKNVDTWFALYSWCEENQYEFKDLPPFEKYINILETMGQPEKQITEIYIPIE